MKESLTKNQSKHKSMQQLKNDVSKNRKILDDICNVNETLKQSLKQLKSNVKQTIRPNYQKLENERLALQKLLYFDENHSLKQNFTIVFNQKNDEKQRLLNYLENFKKMNEDLSKKSISYKSQINQSKTIEESMKFEKNELINQLENLQEEKFKKMSVKLQKQAQKEFREEESQVEENVNFSGINTQTSLEKDNANYFDQGNQSSSKQLESSIVYEQNSIIYRQDSIQQVFGSGLDSKEHPKSKQILNSLQKQLNPLRINEHIEYLERQIGQIKSQKLKMLEQQMKKEIGLNKKLKQNYKDTNNKLEMMKKHVKRFKLQRFGTDKL